MDFPRILDSFYQVPSWAWVLLGVFGVCWLVQLWFSIFRFGKVAGLKRLNGENAPPSGVGVSVIVCAHNNLSQLKTLLDSLRTQAYSDYEVIVVDDRSDDEMYDWLLEQGRRPGNWFRLVRINFTPEHINPKKYALTMGIKAARKPVVLLTDADCEPVSQSWIAGMAAQFNSGIDMVLGYSPYRRLAGALNSLVRFDAFYTGLQYFSFAMAGTPYMGVGRNLGYRRSFFFENKGFRQHTGITGGDDDLFVNRLGLGANVALSMQPGTHVISDPKTSFGQWFRQKRRHLSVGKLYKTSDKVRLGLLIGSHIGFYWCFFMLLFVWPLTLIALAAFTVRLLVHSTLLYYAARKLNDPFGWFQLILLDGWMPIHYLLFGVPALVSKKIEWN